MAIEFFEGIKKCGDCVSGEGEFTEAELAEVNDYVTHFLGHETTRDTQAAPLGRFMCGSMIATGFCGNFRVEDHGFPPDVCRVDPEKMRAISERNVQKARALSRETPLPRQRTGGLLRATDTVHVQWPK